MGGRCAGGEGRALTSGGVRRGWELGWGQLACEMAAVLEERDVLRGMNKPSDLRVRIDVLRGKARIEAVEVDRCVRAKLCEPNSTPSPCSPPHPLQGCRRTQLNAVAVLPSTPSAGLP